MQGHCYGNFGSLPQRIVSCNLICYSHTNKFLSNKVNNWIVRWDISEYVSYAWFLFWIKTYIFYSNRILKTDAIKNFWTSVASVGVPICFVSKDDIPAMPHAGQQFHKFYKWNSVLFAVMSILTLIGLNFMLYFNVFLTYNCSNLPFLSCQDGSVDPREGESEMCLRLTSCDPGKMHFNFRIYGNVTIFVLSIFDMVLVWMQNAICPSLRGVSNWFMRPM